MKKKNDKILNLIAIIVFLGILTVPTLLFVLIGENNISSFDEKREKSDFPSEVSDFFLKSVENWYADNAPYRTSIIDAKMKAFAGMDAFYRNNIQPGLSEALAPEWYKTESSGEVKSPEESTEPGEAKTAENSAEQGEKGRTERSSGTGTDVDGPETVAGIPAFIPDSLIDTESYFPPTESGAAIYGRGDWLFYGAEGGLECYLGTNLLSEEEMVSWRRSYEDLNDACEKKGIRLAVMIAPNKEQVYPEYMPSYRIESEVKREDIFAAYMKDSPVNYMYILDEMKAARGKCELYFRQDTHWNTVGAYVGLEAIYRSLGLEYTELKDVSVTESPVIGGDISNFCGFQTDYIQYDADYRPEVNLKEKSHFDGYAIEFTSDRPRFDSRAVVIGDSFSKAFRQLIPKDFAESVVMTRDVLDTDLAKETCESLKEGDILILMAVERYDQRNVDASKTITGWFR